MGMNTTTTTENGVTTVHTWGARYASLVCLDPFQRAVSKFHTLKAIAWTLARVDASV